MKASRKKKRQTSGRPRQRRHQMKLNDFLRRMPSYRRNSNRQKKDTNKQLRVATSPLRLRVPHVARSFEINLFIHFRLCFNFTIRLAFNTFATLKSFMKNKSNMLKNMLLVSLRLEVDEIHFLKSIKLKD
jgi:hypothetical protein